MSTQFLTDPKVEDLGEKHGPAGPLVVVALLGRAKIADDAGRVTCSFRTLGNEAFVDRTTAREIVNDMVRVGLVESLSESESEASVRFPAWRRWQDAGRKAKERESREPTSQANVRTRPEASRPVPTDKTERQDKQDKKDKTNKTAGTPTDASRSEFDEWLADYHRVTGRTSVTGSKAARDAFKARCREGKTLQDLKFATRGCQSDPWRIEKGHNIPETILRASNVEGYISQAKDQPARAAPTSHANRFAEMARQAEIEERQVA